MRFSLLHGCYTLLSVALVGSHVVTPDVYWNYVLPNTPMPKPIQESLTEWNHGKGAMVGADDQQKEDMLKWKTPSFLVLYDVSKDRQKDHGEQPYNDGGLKSPFDYLYAPSKHQLIYDPNVALFFLQNNLNQGAKMNLHFPKNYLKSMFLPRKIALLIPFSSNNLPQIYDHFSIKPKSLEAKVMKQTLKQCENKGIEGEDKYCATSLESMIDFVTEKLGHKVKAISTEVNAKESIPLQKYKIEFVKDIVANKAVVCHRQNYAYAVFYCHKTVGSRVYVVSMVGVDGVKVKPVAVCHTDTTKWNPKHLAFQVLKVKPGSVPVCHFLPEDHVVWVPY